MEQTEMIPLISAVIAAIITLIGIIVNFFISRKQILNNSQELKLKESDLKANQERFKEEIRFKGMELENEQTRLKSEIEELKQNQLHNIILKRLEVYPKLWAIHIKYETNWTYDKKKKDKNWATEYVNALNEINLEIGIFFSQDLYKKFVELRRELYSAIENADKRTLEIQEDHIINIRRIVYGHNGPGLSTIEKDDLGSYINVAVAKRK